MLALNTKHTGTTPPLNRFLKRVAAYWLESFFNFVPQMRDITNLLATVPNQPISMLLDRTLTTGLGDQELTI